MLHQVACMGPQTDEINTIQVRLSSLFNHVEVDDGAHQESSPNYISDEEGDNVVKDQNNLARLQRKGHLREQQRRNSNVINFSLPRSATEESLVPTTSISGDNRKRHKLSSQSMLNEKSEQKKRMKRC